MISMKLGRDLVFSVASPIDSELLVLLFCQQKGPHLDNYFQCLFLLLTNGATIIYPFIWPSSISVLLSSSSGSNSTPSVLISLDCK